MQSNWEEAHSALLRECVEKGLPFSEIARGLNKRFGTTYSRNAAIGRARRMGLCVPERAGGSGVWAQKKPPDAKHLHKKRAHSLAQTTSKTASKIAPRSEAKNATRTVPKPTTFERAEALQLRCVAINPRHLALVDLEPGDCRYPYGGDADGEPITFCGHPRRDGSSYCSSHFHLTLLPPEQLRERARAKPPLRLVEAA
jgi:GcrA cell cycle regulator